MTKPLTDADMLIDSYEVLKRMPCMFWACNGDTASPRDMVTCARCQMVYRLRRFYERKARG